MVLAGLQQQWLLPSRRAAATAPRAFAPPLALPLRRMRRQAPSFRCRAATALNAPMAAAVPEVPRSEQQQRRRAVVARTSADWWEDEEVSASEAPLVSWRQPAGRLAPTTARRPPSCHLNTIAFYNTFKFQKEYDAITEILDPKRVFLLTPEAAAARPPPPAIAAAAPRLVTAFASERALGAAEALWQELGRAGPPLFLKVRARAPLTELDGDGGSGGKAAAEAAEAFWAEALSQSWCVSKPALACLCCGCSEAGGRATHATDPRPASSRPQLRPANRPPPSFTLHNQSP